MDSAILPRNFLSNILELSLVGITLKGLFGVQGDILHRWCLLPAF